MSEIIKAEIKLGKYKGIEVKRQIIEATEDEVNAELARAQEIAATHRDKTDEPIELGDQALIDFTGYIDGVAFPGGDGTDYPLVIGSGAFIPGFEEQLVGKHAGEEADVTVKFPENYHAPEFAGKDAVFKVTIKGVQTSIVPELTDAVIEQVSGKKSIDEFIEFVKSEIVKRKSEENDIAKENMILGRIIETSEINVPDELVEQRASELKNSFQMQLKNSGQSMEDYFAYNGLTEESYNEYAKRDALTMLQGQAVLLEIAALEGLTSSLAEVEQELTNMAKAYQMEEARLREIMGDRGLSMLEDDIKSKKALAFLSAQATEI